MEVSFNLKFEEKKSELKQSVLLLADANCFPVHHRKHLWWLEASQFDGWKHLFSDILVSDSWKHLSLNYLKGGFPLTESFPQTGTERKIFRGQERKIFCG